jgi:hypothetical protein
MWKWDLKKGRGCPLKFNLAQARTGPLTIA